MNHEDLKNPESVKEKLDADSVAAADDVPEDPEIVRMREQIFDIIASCSGELRRTAERIIYSATSTINDIDDILQVSMMKMGDYFLAQRQIPDRKDVLKLASRRLSHETISSVRKRARELFLEEIDPATAEAATSTKDATFETGLIYRGLRACQSKCLNKYSTRHQAILIEYSKIRDGHERKEREQLARRLGTTYGTLRKDYRNLLDKLSSCVSHCVKVSEFGREFDWITPKQVKEFVKYAGAI
jgi:DNA-directed RNA polymerase specialized sigma24 family protein